jgi:hypothetical protein
MAPTIVPSGMRGDAAGRAQEHGVSEGEQPAIADQQAEGAVEQRDEGLHQEQGGRRRSGHEQQA